MRRTRSLRWLRRARHARRRPGARGGVQPARPAAPRRGGGGHRRGHRRGADRGRDRSSPPGWRPPLPGTSRPGHAGFPPSSGHALVGGLVGAGVVAAAAAITGAASMGRRSRGARRARRRRCSAPWPASARSGRCGAGRRATRRWRGPVRGGEWATSAALAFGHGANDAQKSVGVIAALLVADGRRDRAAHRRGRSLACAAALTAGTALGGWRIVGPSGAASTACARSTRSRARARRPASSWRARSWVRPRRRARSSRRPSSASAAAAAAGTTSTGRPSVNGARLAGHLPATAALAAVLRCSWGPG